MKVNGKQFHKKCSRTPPAKFHTICWTSSKLSTGDRHIKGVALRKAASNVYIDLTTDLNDQKLGAFFSQVFDAWFLFIEAMGGRQHITFKQEYVVLNQKP